MAGAPVVAASLGMDAAMKRTWSRSLHADGKVGGGV